MTSRTTTTLRSLAAASCLMVASPALAQGHGHDGDETHAQHESHSNPVNKMCPIAKEPIDGTTFATHNGKTVGFCCPGCDKAFMKWEEKRRTAFVLAAMREEGPGSQDPHAVEKVKGDPYLLNTCPVTGQKLGSMGEPIVKVVEGREVRLCCGGCIERFEANAAKYFAEIDKSIAKQQMRFYPLDTCIVTGEPLVVDGKDIGTNHVHKNRLVRLCCKGCVREFETEPAKFLKQLDEAVVKAQLKEYPLDTCAVLESSKLGSMGKPVNIVVANRLVQFCCAGCKPQFEADPAKFIARLDAAWIPIHKAQGKIPAKEEHGAGDHGQGGHGDHDHGGHGHGGG